MATVPNTPKGRRIAADAERKDLTPTAQRVQKWNATLDVVKGSEQESWEKIDRMQGLFHEEMEAAPDQETREAITYQTITSLRTQIQRWNIDESIFDPPLVDDTVDAEVQEALEEVPAREISSKRPRDDDATVRADSLDALGDGFLVPEQKGRGSQGGGFTSVISSLPDLAPGAPASRPATPGPSVQSNDPAGDTVSQSGGLLQNGTGMSREDYVLVGGKVHGRTQFDSVQLAPDYSCDAAMLDAQQDDFSEELQAMIWQINGKFQRLHPKAANAYVQALVSNVLGISGLNRINSIFTAVRNSGTQGVTYHDLDKAQREVDNPANPAGVKMMFGSLREVLRYSLPKQTKYSDFRHRLEQCRLWEHYQRIANACNDVDSEIRRIVWIVNGLDPRKSGTTRSGVGTPTLVKRYIIAAMGWTDSTQKFDSCIENIAPLAKLCQHYGEGICLFMDSEFITMSSKNGGSCMSTLIEILDRCIPSYKRVMRILTDGLVSPLLSADPVVIAAIAAKAIDCKRVSKGEPYLVRVQERIKDAGFPATVDHPTPQQGDDQMEVDG